jgi:peptidoglycan/xylan/chitin deacetylase (PgdA/CDA1 family)
MYLVKMPRLVQRLLPGFTWYIPTREKVLYLSFDDGPIPEVTPWVLDTLHSAGAKATFFCVGENVQRNPGIFQRIIEEGHAVGNHTHQHLNGWKTDTSIYLQNVKTCAERVPGTLFRPPYGRLRSDQARAIRESYRIIMWDVLSGDFDRSIRPEKCLENILQHTRPGSIVVLHDSLKAEPNLRYALPALLEYFLEKNWAFRSLESEISR